VAADAPPRSSCALVTGITITTATVLITLGATGTSTTAMAAAEPGHATRATTFALPATAAPAASAPSQFYFWAYGGQEIPGLLGLYFLHAHAHNAPVDTATSAGFQTWEVVNGIYVDNLNGQQQAAYQIQLVGVANECLNDVGDAHTIYLDSCVPGDMNEYFWPTYLGTGAGTYNYWFINVKASANYNNYQYMTSDRFEGIYGPDVQDLPGGYGQAGVWGLECIVNCG